MVEKEIRIAMNKENRHENHNNQDINKYVSIPYVRGLFENIQKLLSQHNIKAVGNAKSPLSSFLFSQLKDPTPKELQSNLIYKVNCECDATYIGMTKQYLKSRINQHINDNQNNNRKKSALSEHLNEHNHSITLNDVTIVAKENNYRKRSILEMINIKKSSASLNKQTDSDYISNVYNTFIF